MADIDYDKLAQVFEAAFAKSGLSGTSEESRRRRDQNDQIRENIKRLRDLKDSLGKSSDTFSMLLTVMGRQKTQIIDNSKEIQDVNKALRDETNARNRGVLEARRSALEQQQRQSLITAGMFGTVDVLKNTVTAVTDIITSTVGQFVRQLQGRGSAFGLASTLLTGAVNAAGSGLQIIGGGLASAGTALATFARASWARGIGVLMTGLGIGLSSVSGAAAKLAKFGIEVLTVEIEKTVESFRTASTVGALFGGGLTELRDTALTAGLTIEQFSSVLRNSSDAIAQSGMGISEGARMIGRVNRVLANSGVTDKLLKLGFGFEEQAELIAQVSADMRRLGATATDQQVAQQTERYAENLRLIANLTGQDAKAKVAQVREQNNILGFQQRLATMPRDMQNEINTAMATMTQMEQKALRERVIFNGVVRDKDAAIYETQFSGAREKGEAIYRLFETGELTAKRTAAINAEFNTVIKDSVIRSRELGQAAQAGSQVLQGVARGGIELLDQAARQTKGAVAQGMEDLTNAGQALDPLTNSYVAAEKAAQSLRISLQEKLLPLMAKYSEVTVAILSTVDQMLKDIPFGKTKTDTAASTGETVGRLGAFTAGSTLGALGGRLVGGMLGRVAGGLLGSIIPFAGTTVGAIGGGLLGEAIAESIFGGARALGGPVNPGRTYLVGEKGPELFKPSMSGEVLPNSQMQSTVKTDSLLNDLKEIMKEQSMLTKKVIEDNNYAVEIMKEQTMLAKKAIEDNSSVSEIMRDLRSINQQMLNNSY